MLGPVRIAVDIGGTFTDVQLLDESSGQTYAHKTATTPDDPARGLITGLLESAERCGFRFAQVTGLLHGTTIATNAVLERKLPAGALITTAGFEDVLEIGRHVRKEIYSLRAEPRTLLIPRRFRYGVRERITAASAISVPLDEQQARAIARQIRTEGITAVAVCLLHSYINPAHEQRLEAILSAELPGVSISLSSIISPEIREFERTSTTVLNALLMPVVGGYLQRLQARLSEIGFTAPVYLVQSNGGVTTPETAARQPARLLLSGPSGGALAAQTLSRQLHEPHLIAADMGGTSFDVSLIHEGQVRLITQGEIADCPVRLPLVEMRTIGAGGGSIARIGEGGRLLVGPQSAGAEPGPVAYGRGGQAPTVTDAHTVLGRLNPAYFLGGAMRLDGAAAESVIGAQLAVPLALSVAEAADGVLRIANARMATAIRLSLFEKGLDPQDFALLPFGGAAGLHATEIAAELGIGKVIFPRDPGTLSAWGMLFADISHDFARSYLAAAHAQALPTLAAIAAELRTQGEAQLARDGVPGDLREYRLALDMRYPGQAYEISVPWPDEEDLRGAVRAFHSLHQLQYAHADEQVTPQIVTVRLSASGRLSKPLARPYQTGGPLAPKAHRRLFIDNDWRPVPVFERERLAPAVSITGPALIEEPHATLLIPAGWTLSATPTGELIAEESNR